MHQLHTLFTTLDDATADFTLLLAKSLPILYHEDDARSTLTHSIVTFFSYHHFTLARLEEYMQKIVTDTTYLYELIHQDQTKQGSSISFGAIYRTQSILQFLYYLLAVMTVGISVLFFKHPGKNLL